ncbi:MAG: PKD domain-containing protein [Candidatus Hadarchaeales archaeon]
MAEAQPVLANKKMLLIAVVVVVVSAVVGAAIFVLRRGGGEKTENLVAWFTFNPSAPRVGAPVYFTDNSSGNPVSWSWDFGDGGTSTSRNPSHTYSSSGTYTVTLTVTYPGGKQKTVSRTVTVSEEMPSGVYIVYSDAGICPDEVPPVDVFVWSGADWGLEGPVLLDGNYVVPDAPEGTTVFACQSGAGSNNYVGWGVFLGVDAAAGHRWIVANSVDLSRFSKLEFWVKSEVDLKVELEQLPSVSPENNPNARGAKSSAIRISAYGWDRNQPNTWQKVSIPITAFRNVDLTKIRCPFMVTGEGGNKSFYIDEVVWIP